MTAHAFPSGTILGYPRIGRRRELKRAVEAFWAGRDRRRRARGTAPRPARSPPASGSPTRSGRTGLARSPSRSRSTTRCSTPRRRRRGASAVRPGLDADGGARPRGVLHDRPRRRRRCAARDDEVVRLELPLPGPRDRPGHRRSRSPSDRIVERVRRGDGARRSHPAGHRRAGDLPPARQAGRRRARRLPPARPARRPRAASTRELLARLAAAGADLGAVRRARAGQRDLDDPANEVLDAAAGRLRAARRHRTRDPAILVAAPYGVARRRAAGAGGDTRRGDRRSTSCVAHCRRSSTRRPRSRSRRRRSLRESSTGTTSGAATSTRRFARAEARAAPVERGRGVDLDLAAARAARRRRRVGTRRAPRLMARVRRPEGRAGRHARPRAHRGPGGDRDRPRRGIRRPRRPPRRARRARPRGARPARGARRPTTSRARLVRTTGWPRRRARACRALPTTTIGSFPQTGDIRRARARLVQGRPRRGRLPAAHARRDRAGRRDCRRRSASTCSCTASPSATTWCSTSPSSSTASR